MSNISVIEFEKEFPSINLMLKKEDKRTFDLNMIAVHIEESSRGFKVKRIRKTTKKGTSVVYMKFKDTADFESYKSDVIQPLINAFNKEYNADLVLNETPNQQPEAEANTEE